MSTMTMTQTEILAARTQATHHGSVMDPPPNLPKTLIQIDGLWYDLTQWKHTHPGGPVIIDHMHGNDATDAFYSLHSEDAVRRLKRLPSSKTLPAALADNPPPPPTQVTINFRAFREKLVKEGYFRREPFWEAFYTSSIYFLCMFGTYLAFNGWPVMATILIGFGMQQAGWIGHDNIHARGTFFHWNAVVMQWINAFSRGWWSNKHNTHHVYTNYIGIDADIENDPVFHLFFPDPKDDTIFRKMQHWYFIPVASVLYISWRIQSLQHSLKTMDWKELIPEAINYIWLYFLGWKIALASIYLGGFLVAIIVTVTHQSEEMLEPAVGPISDDSKRPGTYSFCEGQFLTTRDARTNNFFMEWLWGGMQYQLEHHLFPTMPKYNFKKVAPLVEQFAKDNGLHYRCDVSQVEIFNRNFHTLKFFAQDIPKKAE